MDLPKIRAKAKDAVESLDNATAYLDSSEREEIVECVRQILTSIEEIIRSAPEGEGGPLSALRTYTAKFNDYWNSPQT